MLCAYSIGAPIGDGQDIQGKPLLLFNNLTGYLLPAPTMVTTIDVEVEDDWTRTVTSTPIISPQTGLPRIESLENMAPAARPEKNAIMQLELS